MEEKQMRDTDMVCVSAQIPDILVELRYGGPENFLNKPIYEFQEAYLRRGTVKKLAAVQADLRSRGLGLKIWDAFRPVSAQFALWKQMPDSDFVADPRKGYSNHSRGNAVDVTLVDASGRELPMPTAFDSFLPQARRDCAFLPEPGAGNSELLCAVMEEHGFHAYEGEWWHFADSVRYEVELSFHPPK